MKLDSLKKLFVEQLKDMYSAENQLIKALPKMREAAGSPDLQSALEHHLDETKEHARRLEEVCEEVGYRPAGSRCEAMAGLIEEGEEILKSDADEAVRDAAIICAAQKVEHYEIGSYGCLKTYARILGYNKSAQILEKTLSEEKAADSKLTQIAESSVNVIAGGASA